ncbi:unnamed protein product [Calypogeia fissa]
MSSSTNPPVLCTICDSNGTQLCTQCRTLRYCSKECQRIDWPTHKLLCRSFSDFRTPPGPTFKRAILFPVSEKTPKFIWLKILREYDEEDGYAYDSPQLKGLLGAGDPISSRVYVQKNILRNRTLDNTIVVACRDAFLIDGSLPNQSIRHATRGEHAHRWAGPMVVFQLVGLDNSDPRSLCCDITLADFRHAVDHFKSYNNENCTSRGLRGVREVKGVKISCKADQELLGVEKYIQASVEDSHEVFRVEEPIPISRLIELPILVRKCPPHKKWKNRPDADYTNLPASWLHLDLNPKSDSFGFFPFEWDERVGTVIAVRVDRKVLFPHHMEALCHFCQFTLMPLIEDSIGVGLVERTRDEVMGEMTKAKFKEFFSDYKVKNMLMDRSWMTTPCPYDV